MWVPSACPALFFGFSLRQEHHWTSTCSSWPSLSLHRCSPPSNLEETSLKTATGLCRGHVEEDAHQSLQWQREGWGATLGGEPALRRKGCGSQVRAFWRERDTHRKHKAPARSSLMGFRNWETLLTAVDWDQSRCAGGQAKKQEVPDMEGFIHQDFTQEGRKGIHSPRAPRNTPVQTSTLGGCNTRSTSLSPSWAN